jgi:hypothetical protein
MTESDYQNVSVPDEDLPEDLQEGEENPLAEPPDAGADQQELGDPRMPGLERDQDDRLFLPGTDDEDATGES